MVVVAVVVVAIIVVVVVVVLVVEVVVVLVVVVVVAGSSLSQILFSFWSRQQLEPTCIYGGLHTMLLPHPANKTINNTKPGKTNL